MASLQVYFSKGHEYARIVESYRDPITRKPKTRILKALGRTDDLEAAEPGILDRLRRELKESGEAAARLRRESVMDAIASVEAAGRSGFPAVCYGSSVYKAVWDELGLGELIDGMGRANAGEAAEMLTLSRLMAPASKRRSCSSQGRMLPWSDPVSLDRAYRCLKVLANNKLAIETHINGKLSGGRELSVAFYDVTTYYFESVEADAIRRFGYSKDNMVNQVQVVMGLLIDSEGVPVAYDLFPGNTSDFSTLEPAMRRLKSEHGVNKVVITADRGLNSKKNLALLRSLGYGYVMSYKIRSAPEWLKREVFDEDAYIDGGKGFRWRECGLSYKVKTDDGQSLRFEDRLIVTWSLDRAAKDRSDRERLVDKAKRLSESKSALKAELKKGGKKYLQLALVDDEAKVDEARIEDEGAFDGYYAVQCSETDMDARKILETYSRLWKIEESFRIMKSTLEARPVFVWSEWSIKGHFVMCYIALVVERLLELRLRRAGTPMSADRIREALLSDTVTVIEEAKGGPLYIRNAPNDDYMVLAASLGLEPIPACGRVKDLERALDIRA